MIKFDISMPPSITMGKIILPNLCNRRILSLFTAAIDLPHNQNLLSWSIQVENNNLKNMIKK